MSERQRTRQPATRNRGYDQLTRSRNPHPSGRNGAVPRALQLFGTLVALVLVLIGLRLRWQQSEKAAGIDFIQFWAGPRVARDASSGSIYQENTRRASARDYLARATSTEPSERMRIAVSARPRFEFYSTPFLYTTFAVFRGTYDRSYLLFRILSFAAAISGLLLLGRAAGLPLMQTLFIIAFVLTLYQPMKAETRVGNVNCLQLLLFGVVLVLHSRRWQFTDLAAGVLFGAATMFKPNVGVILPLLLAYLLMRRQFVRFRNILIAAFGGAAVAFGVSSLFFRSPKAWTEWFASARELSEWTVPRPGGNITLVLALIERWGVMITIASVVLWMSVVLIAAHRGKGDDQTPVVISLGMLIYLLSANLVWMHYLLLALPLALLLMGREASRAERIAAIVALTLLAADPWTKLLQIRTHAGEAIIVNSGLLLLFAAAVWRLARTKGLIPVAERKKRVGGR